jgi:hypothetical protein
MGKRLRKWKKNIKKNWSILMFVIQNRSDKLKEETNELNCSGRQTDSFRTVERKKCLSKFLTSSFQHGFHPCLGDSSTASHSYPLFCWTVQLAGFFPLPPHIPPPRNFCNSKATVGLSQPIRHHVWDECGSAWHSYVLAEGSGVIKLSGCKGMRRGEKRIHTTDTTCKIMTSYVSHPTLPLVEGSGETGLPPPPHAPIINLIVRHYKNFKRLRSFSIGIGFYCSLTPSFPTFYTSVRALLSLSF